MDADEFTKVVLSVIGDMSAWLPTALMVFAFVFILIVTVPFLIVLFAKNKATAGQDGAETQGRKPRKMRRVKWNLEPLQKKDLPIEMQGKSKVAAAVKRYADKQENSDSDSEEEQKLLTPEQILAQHQEVPREPHLGIFLGIEDPTPQKENKKNSRCGIDARDLSEAMAKLDYRTFTLQDYKSHKSVTENTTLPTRLNLATLLRSLKDGRYDDATRKKPNPANWENCLLYLATKVRVTTYANQKSETLEFLMRQDMEMDAVWIDMVELINKVSDIPFRQLFVILDVVHTGEDDIKFDDGEDLPNPGKPVPMSELLRRTGVMSGIVNSQRCSVVGMTRPDSMPREMSAELQLDKTEKPSKIRNGPFVHFLLAGLKEVEKRDPNAELWKSLSNKGLGGMGGGFGMMPTVAPVTSGDLEICPFHCGDMTVDSIYRFLSKKVRLLLKDPLNDPAYHQGCVKMAMAVQKAVRPRDTPETPAYMHECKREGLKNEIVGFVKPAERKHVTVALYGDKGVGKASMMLSVAWTKESLDSFSDGIHYFCLRDTLENLEAGGTRFISNMQQTLARHACGFEGMLQTYENGTYYLGKHFAGLKCLILVDDVACASDVHRIVDAIGSNENEKPMTAVLLTTTSKEVADACMHTVNVPRLTEEECNKLLSSSAGLLGPADLPEVATSICKVYQSLPLHAVMLGSAMRGADSAKWEKLSKDVSETDGDMDKLMEILLDATPELTATCLKKLACIPPKRAVSIPALLTLWHSEIGGIDWNKLYAVLAQILDCGMGRLVLEEDYSLLLHPLIAKYLKKLSTNSDAEVIELYRQHNGIPEDNMEPERWLQIGWDGYFHAHGAGHLHAIAPELTAKLFESPQWVVAVHDSCKIDKLLADYGKYGGTSKGAQDIKSALKGAVAALRRHPWELVPQLVNRLSCSSSQELKDFCSGLQEQSRPATPHDKHFLWLRQITSKVAFEGIPCTCVGFYKDYIVSGYENGVVVLWNIKDGEKVMELEGHKAAVHGVVSTGDGSLATGSKSEEIGSRIRKWDLETRESSVLSVLDKPGVPSKADKAFNFKVTMGRTGTDIKDHDEDTFGYSTKHIITDTVLVEHEEDSEIINCHTFVGWDSNLVCTSLTFDQPINEVRTLEHNGRLLVATAESSGSMSLHMLMTNDTIQQQAVSDSD